MNRIEALDVIYEDIKDCVVVTIMGAVAAELYSLGHKPNFFYLEHAMGLASSMGLGVALARPDQQVVVLDGDGSVLMNLGTFTTLARYSPKNLVHVIFDNESLLSVGGFPTATSTGSDLAALARGAGISRATQVNSPDALRAAVREGLHADELACVVAKVKPIGPKSFHMDVSLLENRFEFARYFKNLDRSSQNAGGKDS